MQDKTILITGATAGIGKATAIELAKTGARIVITSRNKEKGNAAVNEIKKLSGNNKVEFITADLSSISSIKNAVNSFKKRYKKLNVLINNAAIFNNIRIKTADGLEEMFVTNYFSQFILVHFLLDELKAAQGARVVNVSAPAFTKPRFDDLQSEKKFNAAIVFGITKAEILLFTYELSTRLQSEGITVNAFHPGLVKTGLLYKAPFYIKVIGRFINTFIAKSPKIAGKYLAELATLDKFKNISGQLISKSKPIKATFVSETEIQKKLWDASEELMLKLV